MTEGSGSPAKNLILVVDDEGPVLRAVTAILSGAGFRAEVATGGREGLARYRELRGQVALVLADVVMPDCDGVEMAEQIREIDPGARILFMTGYADGALALISPDVLHKPFLAADLVRKVEQMLRRGENAAAG